MPQDGILAVEFYKTDVRDSRRTAWNQILDNPKGAQLLIRWEGVKRYIQVSRDRAWQATHELLQEAA